MTMKAGDDRGGNRGTDTGSPRDFSPAAAPRVGGSPHIGEASANAPRPLPSVDGAFRLLAAGIVRVIPVMPSPYGDDYLRTSLSTTSIIGMAAA